MILKLLSRVLAALGALSIVAQLAYGQPRLLELGIGSVSPRGPLGNHRSTGPLVRAAVNFIDTTSSWRLRVDAHASFMPGQVATEESSVSNRDLRLIGTMVDLAVDIGDNPVTPFVLFGAGLQILSVSGVGGGSSTVLGVRGGAGLRVKIQKVQLNFEFTPTFAPTSRGTGDDVWLVRYYPASISFSILGISAK